MSTSSEYDSVREATGQTMPRHIWRHHVELESIRRGAVREHIDALRARINAAYSAGEPVWMMVDELVLRSRQIALAERVSESARSLQRMIAGLEKKL